MATGANITWPTIHTEITVMAQSSFSQSSDHEQPRAQKIFLKNE